MSPTVGYVPFFSLLRATPLVINKQLYLFWCDYFPLYLRTTERRQPTKSWNTWTAPRPSQSPIDPPTWKILLLVFNVYVYFDPTSERNLLRVGFTKSVVVTPTVEEKVISILVSFSSNSYKNFVSVWVVLHGREQSDTELPSAKS